MKFDKTHIEFETIKYHDGLKQLKDARQVIIAKWERLGLLEGLTGHWDMPDNIRNLYESQTQQRINL